MFRGIDKFTTSIDTSMTTIDNKRAVKAALRELSNTYSPWLLMTKYTEFMGTDWWGDIVSCHVEAWQSRIDPTPGFQVEIMVYQYSAVKVYRFYMTGDGETPFTINPDPTLNTVITFKQEDK